MNITQLKYVIEVSGSSSMREASSKLYVTQPALSASIRELEDELGIVIFERTNKGVSVTDDGREFLTYAKKAVGQYEILEDRYFSRESGRERFSVSTQHYNFAIKAFTELIRKTDPSRYLFSIHETKTKEVLDDVGRMKSEVGVISFSGSNEAILKKLFREYRLDFVPLMKRDTFV
ncbi:MAG: LysR family transcriptional regulator [Clostridia bacterium]|nr:LysR family transcriptional regulator [Clostridia bacterium]